MVTTKQKLPHMKTMSLSTSIHIFGPCSLESLEQIAPVAAMLKRHGLIYMRTQLFKPRTNPDSFQGLGEKGIEILQALRLNYSKDELKFVCEVCSTDHLNVVGPWASIIQIGARNMQNFELLKAVGKYFGEPHDFVLLKRGFANTVEEWLESARYLIKGGVPKEKIILCERGTRSVTSPTGVQLDFIAALEAYKAGFKVIVDPSHGSKKSEFVIPLARASLQLGLDGIMVECHPDPKQSVSDAQQALSLEETEAFIESSLK
jgi:3-deoxy-7-phosphoheptulonate synthase